MLAIPAATLWRPRPRVRPWWYPPLLWNAEGDISLDTNGNFLLASNGNFKIKDASPDCCCTCNRCSDRTPAKYTVTLAGTSVISSCCTGYSSGTDFWDETFSGGSFDGTYELSMFDPSGIFSTTCLWVAYGGGVSRDINTSGGACGSGTFKGSCSGIGLRLEKFFNTVLGYNQFIFQVAKYAISWSGSPTRIMSCDATVSNRSLFRGSTASEATCDAGPYVITNQHTSGACETASTTASVGFGGTATITPG